MIRRLLPLAGVIYALIAGAQTASASTPGLHVAGYIIDAIPPIKSDTAYPQCADAVDDNINIVYEYEPLGQCGTDSFMAHYTGTITIPAGTDTVQFWVAADDGGTMKIGREEFGTWDDKGCSASVSDVLTLPAGVPIPLDGWFYENGGATCWMLAWRLDDGPWEIVPTDAFNTGATTTTTTEPTTTSTSTTTTSTTAAPVPQTLPEPTTTAAPISTTIVTQANTTTTQTPASSTSPSQTTPTPTTIQPPSTASTVPVTTSLAITTTAPMTTNVTTISSSSTTTTVPQPVITPAEALQAATNPDTLAHLDPDQADQVFAALDIENLTPAQAAAVVAAVQNAPDTVRASFEDKVNIFAGATDTYIPLGSRVPVRTRRVIIITTGLLVAMPSPRRRTP